MRTWPVLTSFTADHLRRIALPLGGIGTGTVSLGGRGDLRDWEIMNVPAKGFIPAGDGGAGHVVIRTLDDAGQTVMRLCEGPIDPADWLGATGCPEVNHGLPRFSRCHFDAAYPLAQVHLEDPEVPLTVRLEAFNPLIPGDVEASSLPVAVVRYVVTNTGTRSRPVTLCATMPNFIGVDGSKQERNWEGRLNPVGSKNNRNQPMDSGDLHGVMMDSLGVDPTDAAWGSIALALQGDGACTRRCHWASGGWGKPLLDFWDDLLADGRLDERPDFGEQKPMASVAQTRDLAAGASTTFTVLIAWRFPNRMTWTPAEGQPPDIIGNHYATVFTDAWKALELIAPRLPDLERRTVDFVATIVDSDLPRPLADAALSNLSTLRSQTCFRTPDGFLFGWEGVHDSRGSCHGSCTHVWNYEHVTAQLFPSLARGMREVEFLHLTKANGGMTFRASLPLERSSWTGSAADGQLGCLVKLWREWQLCGDDAWLGRLWPQARKALEFCWIKGGWDGDVDGVMEGCQHNTMDVEYNGPNPQMQGWYLAALQAAEKMARHLGDSAFADQCARLFTHGSAWMDRELWNGTYYEHHVTTIDKATIPPALMVGMGGGGSDEFQLANGCLVDQLVGQACASLYGLGHLHDPSHIATTLVTISNLNRRSNNREQCNPARSFALGDEDALIMAHYPSGRRPAVPFPYFAEVMTGFEYTAAIGLVQAGMDALALRTVADIRNRHNGKARNPFSEPECGHHYARAMASWGVLLAWTGQRYDAMTKTLHLGTRDGHWPWCTAGGFGTWYLDGSRFVLTCVSGSLHLRTLTVGNRSINHTRGGALTAGDEFSGTLG